MPARQAVFNGASDTYIVSDDGLNVYQKTLQDLVYPWLDERDGRNMMFLLSGTTVKVSTDGGDTVTTLSGSLPRAHSNACLKTRTGIYLVGLAASEGVGVQVARSVNGGSSWSTVTLDTDIVGASHVFFGSLIECDDGSILAHRRPNGGLNNFVRVYRSTDDGATWTTTHDPSAPDGSSLGAMSNIRGVILLANGDGVSNLRLWRSTDNGGSWTQVLNAGGRQLFDANSSVRSVFALKTDGTRIYFYTSTTPGAERYYSTDQGASWTLESLPAENVNIWGIISTASALFITRDVSGVRLFKSVDDGQTQTEVSVNGYAQFSTFNLRIERTLAATAVGVAALSATVVHPIAMAAQAVGAVTVSFLYSPFNETRDPDIPDSPFPPGSGEIGQGGFAGKWRPIGRIRQGSGTKLGAYTTSWLERHRRRNA